MFDSVLLKHLLTRCEADQAVLIRINMPLLSLLSEPGGVRAAAGGEFTLHPGQIPLQPFRPNHQDLQH